MTYNILTAITVIALAVFLLAFILIAMLFLEIIGTEAHIEAEEHRKKVEDDS